MVSPDDVVRALLDGFDRRYLDQFRRFMEVCPGTTKWMIVSDYCVHDPTRSKDVMALSIVPYQDWFPNIQDRIRVALPKDIKKTRNIAKKTIEFLRQPNLFHISVILDRDRTFFTNGAGSDRLAIARQSIRRDLAQASALGRDPGRIARFRQLEQASLVNSFNVELMSDLAMLALLYSFASLLLAREGAQEIIGWFSDRDNLTTWCDGVLWDYARENVSGIAERLGIPLGATEFAIAVPDPSAPAKDPLWYDELIRIADYFAGTVAALDKTTNVGPSDKFARLLRGVIADAENVAILRLRIGDDGLQVRGREISLRPIAPTLRIGRTALSVSSARLARISKRLFRMPSEARDRRIMQARQILDPLRNLARSDATGLTTRQKDAIATILSQGITLIE
jgi:hypothetical protein